MTVLCVLKIVYHLYRKSGDNLTGIDLSKHASQDSLIGHLKRRGQYLDVLFSTKNCNDFTSVKN